MIFPIADIFTIEHVVSLLTLAGLEIVLGVDNLVMLAIVTDRLPPPQQPRLRQVGLLLAMLERIGLLLAISWVASLTQPLLEVFGLALSGRALILAGGGAFLLVKSAREIWELVRGDGDDSAAPPRGHLSRGAALVQIVLLDSVFSLDSVITAVGMAQEVWIMIAAVVAAVLLMMAFANPLSNFILRRPRVKMLALAFLFAVGGHLVAEGLGLEIDKNYLYTAMGFAAIVELLNELRSSAHSQSLS